MDSSTAINQAQLGKLKDELFELTRLAVVKTGMPYASMIVDRRTGIVIAKDYNTTIETFDPSDQGSVTCIRKAKEALETADLSHTYIFAFFEPTVLSFDIALFAGITNFAWCINATDTPSHYVIKDYTLKICAQQHPDKVRVVAGFAHNEALNLLKDLALQLPKGFRLG